MQIRKFKPYEKNTLKGFIEVELESGMVIKDIIWHQREDREWLGMPARQYEKEDGSKGWSNQVDFATNDRYWSFVNQVLAALRTHNAGEVPEMPEPDGHDYGDPNEDVPF